MAGNALNEAPKASVCRPRNSCMIAGRRTGGVWYVTPAVTKKKTQMENICFQYKRSSDF